MFRKVPLIGHPIGLGDLFSALCQRDPQAAFLEELKDILPLKHLFLTNTGIAAFYLILLSLKKISKKREVILPCYTAPSLVVAVQKAGLKPILCDISLKDFNADSGDALRRVTPDTLCVTAVHMFGIPWLGAADLKSGLAPGTFVIEDCAQALGSKIDGKHVGASGDFSFYSFNRGKNLPTYEGGCMATNSQALALELESAMKMLPKPDFASRLGLAFKLAALSFAFRPYIYGPLYFLISRFKDNTVPEDFRVLQGAPFEAGVGRALLRKSGVSFEKRLQNGLRLISALKGIAGILVPEISGRSTPVFNRLPVVFDDRLKLDRAILSLEKNGIETSRLYLKPLHHIFELGYRKEDFPNAVRLAQGLLTLPVHPLVTDADIATMIRVIREVAG